MRNLKSGHRYVYFLSNQTTTNVVQRGVANIAKWRVSNGKLTKVKNEHSLVGKKSAESKSKVGDEEGEEQGLVGSAMVVKGQYG